MLSVMMTPEQKKAEADETKTNVKKVFKKASPSS